MTHGWSKNHIVEEEKKRAFSDVEGIRVRRKKNLKKKERKEEEKHMRRNHRKSHMSLPKPFELCFVGEHNELCQMHGQ